MKILFSFLASFLITAVYAAKIDYTLSMPNPNNHYYHVQMEIDEVKDKFVEVKMPIWAPGSYLAREFAKSVNLVKAKDSKGKALEVKKISKNTWRISNPSSGKITVNYEVYAFELSVRTSFLDNSHGYLNGTSIFMYVKGAKDSPGKLKIEMPKLFKKVSTTLKDEGDFIYSYISYDNLVDCPIEIGNHDEFTFEASGVKHRVAMYGVGNYDVETLKRDMAKIVVSATNVFGENPNEEYLFIIHNLAEGGGGLEHTNSTTLQVNRWTYQGSSYLGFLSLVAHEYFHLWNVKRIRPKELGPFNYDSENYTCLLWVMEGVTSYYDELLLRRAGFYDKDQSLGKLFSQMNYIENQEGYNVQPVAHASFDAWIKAYRPNENSANTTISYYSKGSVVAAMIDLMIIKKYKGKKCLDHFMQQLYKDFYKGKKRGFTEEEFQASLEKFLGMDLTEFFHDYVHGTKRLEYSKFFSYVGLSVSDQGEMIANIGISIKSSGSNAIVSRVRSGSAADEQGINVNDEIIALNGFRVNANSLRESFNSFQKGDVMELLFSRDEIIKTVEIEVTERHQYSFRYSESSGSKLEKLLDYWLRVD